MNWKYVIFVCVIVLALGFAGADSISSTIVIDGAGFVSSSAGGQGQTYVSDLFTTNVAVLMSDLVKRTDGTVKAVIHATSAGPLGIYEYSGQERNETRDGRSCIFSARGDRSPGQDMISYMGLMQAGEYLSTRTLDQSQTGAVTMVNGSGMLLARAVSDDGVNETTHMSDVAGRMNMTESIIFGGDE